MTFYVVQVCDPGGLWETFGVLADSVEDAARKGLEKAREQFPDGEFAVYDVYAPKKAPVE